MKRVFIFANQTMFAQGVDSLLGYESDLEVVGWETDPDQAIRHIREIQPDVVILARQDVSHFASLDAIAMRFLREGLGAKIIGLNLQDNTICIYHWEQRVIREVEDLLAAIA
jgi:DNA-binding NarL/FixJ family response regulator